MLISNVRIIYTIAMGRRMAYRMMLYGQTTDLRYGHRKSANSCFIHIWGCRRCPYSKISLARAIARTIGCIVSSTSYLVNSYIPDIFDNQLLPFIINHQNRTGTSTEAQTSCRSSVVSRRLADTCLQNYIILGRIMCFSNKSLFICTKLRIR